MCDLTNFEIEKLRIKKKIQESELEIEKIRNEEQPIKITQ